MRKIMTFKVGSRFRVKKDLDVSRVQEETKVGWDKRMERLLGVELGVLVRCDTYVIDDDEHFAWELDWIEEVE